MKKKGNFRKVVSGLLAGMTMLSAVLSPMTAYAAEIRPEEKPPLYEEVKDLLDEDEVVTAKDYEIETGSVFDVKSDYTGLEIKDDNKVKVTFEEAKNDKDEDFTTDHADTYKAVYYVEPVNQEHPKYQISRKLIVREKETEVQTETAGSEAVTESETAGSEQQTEEAEDSESDSEITDIDADEFDDLVEQAQNQDTYDEESGAIHYLSLWKNQIELHISLARINHFHSCFILSPCFSGYQILIMDFSFRQELLCCRLIHLFPLACKEFIILPQGKSTVPVRTVKVYFSFPDICSTAGTFANDFSFCLSLKLIFLLF